MSDQTRDPTEPSLDDVLAECIAAEESGQPLDRQSLAARHPQFAADLAEFFANRDRMQRFAAPLRDAPGSGSAPSRTNGHARGKVRYFGDYELIDEVAAGGMGIVYKARQVSLNRVVAVKMILKGTLATDEDVKRFRAEAEAAANLQHPSIVAIHEVGMHEGQHYFSMDYVEGESLSQRMRDQPLPAREAARYVSEASLAVHYAHQQGTLHRDLKPSNLLIDRHDRVRITDFGLAKRIEDNSELTLTGQILGTPSYMPPEQALGKRSLIGAASDVYSLGAVLYELLAGRPPFRGESPADTLRQVETLDPVSPRLLNPSTPRDLETICLKCLEKEPHKRYGTAQLLADDLGRFLRGEPILARPISSTARAWRWCKRKPAVATAALAVIIALASLVGGGWVLLDNARVGAAYRRAEEARQHAVGLSGQLQKALGDAEDARDNEASLRAEKEAALVKLEGAYGMLDSQRTATQRALDESERLRYQLHIVSADRAIQAKEVSHARELLDACPPSLRHWEWHYMRHLSAYETRVCRNLGEPLRDAALAPGGNSFFGVTAAGRLIHWDLATNAPLPLPEQIAATEVNCLAIHAPTKQLAVGDRHGRVQVIDLETGVNVLTRQLWEKLPVTQVVFRDDGGRVAATGSASVHVLSTTSDRVWILNRTSVNRVVLHPQRGIAYLGMGAERRPGSEQVPRGKWLAQWNYEHGDTVDSPAPESPAITALALSADGELLAAGIADGSIECWRVADQWTRAWQLTGHDDAVRGLFFCEDGQKLASASDDQTLRLWSAETREPLAILREHQAAVNVLDLGPSGKTLLSLGGDSAVLWDTSTREGSVALDASSQPAPRKDRLVSMDVRLDGREVAAASLSGTVYRLDTEKLEVAAFRRGSGGRGIAYGLESQIVVGGTPPQIVQPASEVAPSRGGGSPRSRIAISRDRTRVAIGTGKGVAIYRLPDMAVELEFDTQGGPVIDVAFLDGGQRLATASNATMYRSSDASKPVVAIWDLATQTRLMTLDGCNQTIWDLDASPDEQYLAAAAGGGMQAAPGEVKVWDALTGKLVFDLAGHQLPVWTVAFSPDGRRLASGGGVWSNLNATRGSSELKIWDLETGRLLINLIGHEWTVMDLVFSPDGRRLYTASEDGMFRVWPGVPGILMGQVASNSETGNVRPQAPDDFARGVTLANQKAWTEAIAAFREAIRLKPDHADAHYRLAWALRKTDQFAEAAATWEQAMLLRPPNREEYNNIAWLLASCPDSAVRNPARAVELAKKATELAPENLAYWNTLGVALYRSGDWSGAMAALEKSKDLDLRSFAFGHNAVFLAMCYHQLGNEEKARHWYEQAFDYRARNRDVIAKDERGEELERFVAEAEELGIQTGK